MKITTTTIDGLRIRYAESRRDGAPSLVLLSPLPGSVYSFERVWDPLAEHHDLIALDLPGFGQSESRPDVMTVPAMADFI